MNKVLDLVKHQDVATRIIKGHTISFNGDPRMDGEKALTNRSKGALIIGASGKILWHGDYSQRPKKWRNLPLEDYGDCIVSAGFIDTHIHFPQYRMLASHGHDLLDWLTRFTFKEEARYSSKTYCEKAAEVFLDRLATNGTTSAVVFSSVHKTAADVLLQAASSRTMALCTGKTWMNREAPETVLDTTESAYKDSEALIKKWHRTGRLRYAITPRFAITSSDDQLAAAGDLWKIYPDCLMHTHLSESVEEVALVKKYFPAAKDYTDVYDKFGMLGSGALFAHGLYLSERERELLYDTGSAIAHCPTSNNFLGSGLFDIEQTTYGNHPIKTGLATDVGGGTSYSMITTMAEAYKGAKLKQGSLRATDLFYLATLGNAGVMQMQDEIGSLHEGKWADIVVLDPQATEVLSDRYGLSESLEDVMFSLMMLGDDRAIRASYIAGNRVFKHAMDSRQKPI